MNRAALRNRCRLASMGSWVVSAFFIISVIKILTPSRDLPQVQRITCVKNLKQIGIAFRLWGFEHGDRFPFNVSTNEGGTRELCAIGPDGYDSNSFRHFQIMSNDLGNPLVLVCPHDTKAKPTRNFAELAPINVTYRLRTGPNVTWAGPNQELARCPIDGNVLHCDMTVTQAKAESEGGPGFIDLLKLDRDLRWKAIGAGAFAIAGLLLLVCARPPNQRLITPA